MPAYFRNVREEGGKVPSTYAVVEIKARAPCTQFQAVDSFVRHEKTFMQLRHQLVDGRRDSTPPPCVSIYYSEFRESRTPSDPSKLLPR